MHLEDLILKYRTYQGDLTKKDGTFYTPGNMSEGTGLVERGQQSNQEITNLAVDAVNTLVAALADIMKKKFPNAYSYASLEEWLPEYRKDVTGAITFTPTANFGLVGTANFGSSIDDYSYFLAAKLTMTYPSGLPKTFSCRYADIMYINELIDAQYDEEASSPFMTMTGNTAKVHLINADDFKVLGNLPLSAPGVIEFSYIARQEEIILNADGTLTSEDIPLDPKFDEKILEIMIKRYELSIRKLTQP